MENKTKQLFVPRVSGAGSPSEPLPVQQPASRGRFCRGHSSSYKKPSPDHSSWPTLSHVVPSCVSSSPRLIFPLGSSTATVGPARWPQGLHHLSASGALYPSAPSPTFYWDQPGASVQATT